MSNAIANRPGQNLGSGDVKALFKDIYIAEVLEALKTANVTMDKHMVRTIADGKAAKFPATGLASGGYHTPGNEILGRNIKHTEKTITVDDLLYSDVFVAQIDELMNYYDVRSVYAKEQGYFLAKLWDENILRLMVLAARSASNIPGVTPGGSRVTDAAMKTDATKLAAAIFAAATEFDEKGAGVGEARNCFLKPAQLALLIQNKDTINKLYGGEGSYAQGAIASIGGIDLIKTTHLPTQDLSTDAAITTANRDPSLILSKYRGDYSNTVAVVTTPDSVGTVKLKDLEVEMNYDFRRKGTLIVSSYALGSGILRPECAVELATA